MPAATLVEEKYHAGFQQVDTSIDVVFASTPANGNLIILEAGIDQGGGTNTWPAGFTEFIAYTAGSGRDIKAAWKIASSESSATYTLTTSSNWNGCYLRGQVWSGAHATTPIDVTGAGSDPGFINENDTYTPSAVTTTVNDVVLVVVLCDTGGDLDGNITRAGFTHLAHGNEGPSDNRFIHIHYGTQATAGASGSVTFTVASGAGFISDGSLIMFGIRPAGGGGTPATATPSVVAAVAAVPAPVVMPIRPAVVAGVAAVGAPVVMPVKPATVAAVGAVGAPALSSTEVAVAVAAVAAVPTPTIVISVEAAAVAAVAAVGSPTISTGSTVIATAVAAVAAVPAPTLSTSSTVIVSTVAAVAAVGSPSVSVGGSITVAPSTVAAVAAVGAPTVVTNSTITAVVVAAVAAVGVPARTSTEEAVAVAAVAAVPSPAIVTSSTVTVSTVAAVAAVGTSTVTTGGVTTVTVTVVAATATVPTVAGIQLLLTVEASTVAAVAVLTQEPEAVPDFVMDSLRRKAIALGQADPGFNRLYRIYYSGVFGPIEYQVV